MSRYIVAVRRDRRRPGVTTALVSQVQGVAIQDGNDQRVTVAACADAAAELVRRFNDDLIVEAEIEYRTD